MKHVQGINQISRLRWNVDGFSISQDWMNVVQVVLVCNIGGSLNGKLVNAQFGILSISLPHITFFNSCLYLGYQS
ncbi:MAG: hypothetical protein Q8M08_12785 [Bacteroidales bacterium]|nr:hypothetical protein [Bacteroidales bacterium]